MDEKAPDLAMLASLDENTLWAELGRIVRDEGLGLLPEELERNPNDAQAGYWFFQRQLPNIRRIYCHENILKLVQEKKRHDVAEFVAMLIDLFAAYFGVISGTIILIKIYKIGAERFCAEADKAPGTSG